MGSLLFMVAGAGFALAMLKANRFYLLGAFRLASGAMPSATRTYASLRYIATIGRSQLPIV